MTWQEVRTSFPEQWVVAEAFGSRGEGNRRVVRDLAVLNSSPDSAAALRRQLEIHRSWPSREVLLAFTGWEKLEIEEIHWAGIRG